MAAGVPGAFARAAATRVNSARLTALPLTCGEASHACGAADEVRCARGAEAPGLSNGPPTGAAACSAANGLVLYIFRAWLSHFLERCCARAALKRRPSTTVPRSVAGKLQQRFSGRLRRFEFDAREQRS